MAIKLNDVSVQFYLDTGAEVNVINKETHERIGAPTLQTCDEVARTYDGRTATFLGKGRAEFKRRTLRTQETFYVAPRGSLNLLSYATMQRLGLHITDTVEEDAATTHQPLTLSVKTDTETCCLCIHQDDQYEEEDEEGEEDYDDEDDVEEEDEKEEDDENVEEEEEVEGDKLSPQTQPSKQNDVKLIDTTSDPAQLRSMTEAFDKDTVHQEEKHEENEEDEDHDDAKDEVESEAEGVKLTSQTCIQQKTSS
jgi:hypothetical protein